MIGQSRLLFFLSDLLLTARDFRRRSFLSSPIILIQGQHTIVVGWCARNLPFSLFHNVVVKVLATANSTVCVTQTPLGVLPPPGFNPIKNHVARDVCSKIHLRVGVHPNFFSWHMRLETRLRLCSEDGAGRSKARSSASEARSSASGAHLTLRGRILEKRRKESWRCCSKEKPGGGG